MHITEATVQVTLKGLNMKSRLMLQSAVEAALSRLAARTVTVKVLDTKNKTSAGTTRKGEGGVTQPEE